MAKTLPYNFVPVKQRGGGGLVVVVNDGGTIPGHGNGGGSIVGLSREASSHQQQGQRVGQHAGSDILGVAGGGLDDAGGVGGRGRRS